MGLAHCSSAAQSLVFQSRTSLSPQTPALVLQASFLHTTPPERSRIKQTSRHKAFWHIKKLNKADDEPVSKENKEFLQALLTEQYEGPLKKELAPFSSGEWTMWSRRCGVLATKIGVQPIWLKDGRRIITTLLHVTDCHVVRVTTRDKYLDSYMGEKDGRPCYTGPGRAKGSEMVAMVVVGSGSTDPQKFTKDYCGLFTDSGVMPKRHLARFPVTSNSVGSPCELNSSTPVLSGDSTWYPPYCFPFHNWSMGRRIWQDSGKRLPWRNETLGVPRNARHARSYKVSQKNWLHWKRQGKVQSMAWSEDAWKCWRQIQMGLWIASLADQP